MPFGPLVYLIATSVCVFNGTALAALLPALTPSTASGSRVHPPSRRRRSTTRFCGVIPQNCTGPWVSSRSRRRTGPTSELASWRSYAGARTSTRGDRCLSAPGFLESRMRCCLKKMVDYSTPKSSHAKWFSVCCHKMRSVILLLLFWIYSGLSLLEFVFLE